MQLFMDLAIGRKMAILVCLLLILLAGSSLFGIAKMNAIGTELKTVQSEDIPLIELISQITAKQLEKSILFEKALRVAGVTDAEVTVSDLHGGINLLAEQIETTITQGEEIISNAKSHALSPALQQEIAQLETNLIAIHKEHQSYEQAVETMMMQLEQAQQPSHDDVISLEQRQHKLNMHLEELFFGVEKMTEQALEQVYQDEQSGLWGMIIIAIASILVGLTLGIIITRAITQPLREAVSATQRLADGDLTGNITPRSKDETGQLLAAMKTMNARLLDMVSQIATATDQLSSATTEVAAITTQTANNIENQTQELQQTSVALNEMSATIRDVAQNATEASSSTDQVESGAKQGREVVAQVNQSIHDLADEIEQTKATIGRLNEETANVGSILDVITAISEQTNLLALNAAIEAARAGEHGRGFAVVADEVRTLASRTQDSISTIQSMIDNLKLEANSSVEKMDSGSRKAGNAVALSQRADNSLVEINNAINQIASMNLQIASAAEEQSAVSEEINASVARLQHSEVENSAGAQQVAVATEQLSQLAVNLQALMQQFKLR